MRLISILFLVAPTLALAQPLAPPRIVMEHDGRMTTFRAAGSLESTRRIGCIPLERADNAMTPPDLYLGARECVDRDNFEDAAALFALASVYGRFDAERIADPSAAQAKSVLVMNTFAAVPKEKRARLNEALAGLAKNPDRHRKLCRDVQQVGMPGYHPAYMILHGIEAFSPKPDDNPLRRDFDAPGFWKHLQSVYLHCPK